MVFKKQFLLFIGCHFSNTYKFLIFLLYQIFFLTFFKTFENINLILSCFKVKYQAHFRKRVFGVFFSLNFFPINIWKLFENFINFFYFFIFLEFSNNAMNALLFIRTWNLMRINYIATAWAQKRKVYLFFSFLVFFFLVFFFLVFFFLVFFFLVFFFLVFFFLVFFFLVFFFLVLFFATLISLFKALSEEISPKIFIHPNTAELTDWPELCPLNLIDEVIEFIWALHKLVLSCIYG